MIDEAVAAPARPERKREPIPAPSRRGRARAALRRPANWYELVRFGAVGASGYIVNLAVFALTNSGAGAHYRVAAVLAFIMLGDAVRDAFDPKSR